MTKIIKIIFQDNGIDVEVVDDEEVYQFHIEDFSLGNRLVNLMDIARVVSQLMDAGYSMVECKQILIDRRTRYNEFVDAAKTEKIAQEKMLH